MLRPIILIVLLFVGIGVGWGVSRARHRESDVDRVLGSRSVDPASPHADHDAPPTEVDGGATAVDLETVVAKLEAPEIAEELDGVIRGVVRLEDGSPVADVVVTARVRGNPDSIEVESARKASLEAYVRQSMALYRYRRQLARSAMTDETGRFTLERIGDGEYGITGEAEGLIVRIADPSTARFSAGADVELRAEPAGRVALEVSTPSGVAPATVNVSAEDHAGRSVAGHRWTTIEPGFMAPVGELTLRLRTSEYFPAEESVSVRHGETTTVSVQLAPKLGVRGSVYYANGRPAQEAVVRVTPDGPGIDAEKLATMHHVPSDWVHGGESFSVEVSEPGVYVVGVGFTYNRIDFTQTVEVKDGFVDLDLHFPDPDPNETIVCRVLSPDGGPVSGLQFHVQYEHENSSWGGGLQGQSQPDGSYWLFPDRELLDRMHGEGTLTLSVVSTQYGSQAVALAPSSMEVEVQFEEPATTEVTISNYAGHRLQGLLSLSLMSADQEARFGGSAYVKPSGEGVAKMASVSPGAYRVVLYLKSTRDRWDQTSIAEEVVELVRGENQVQISIPALYRLVVEFDEIGSNRRVQLLEAGDEGVRYSSRRAEIDRESREVVFDNVAEGRYRIERSGFQEHMTVDVRGDIRVRFAADTINALVVRMRSPDGKLANAGFQDGDLITAFGGRAFESMRDVQFAMIGMMTRESVTVTVQRGGSTLEFEIKPTELMQGNMGGSIEPATR